MITNRNFAGILALMVMASLFVPKAHATDPLFSGKELELVDDTATLLERQNLGNAARPAPIEFTGLFSGKSLGLIRELYIDTSPRAANLSPDKRAYYRLHPREFLNPLIQSELGRSRLERFKAIFSARLGSSDKRTRREAIWWLTMMGGDDESIGKVKTMLASNDNDARFDAAVQLTEIGDKSGSKILEEAVKAPPQFKSLEAARALLKIGNEMGKMRLIEIVQSTSTASIDLTDKAIALRSLATMKDSSVDRLILRELRSGNPKLVEAALSCLQLRSDTTIDPATASRIFEILDDPQFGQGNGTAKMAAWDVLLSKPRKDWRESFLRYRDSADPWMRSGMLRGLMQIMTKQDCSFFVRYLDDNDRQVRMQAEYAIRRISGVSVGSIEGDLDNTIKKRKLWWEKNSNAPEFQR